MYHSGDDIGPVQNVGTEEESADEYEEEEEEEENGPEPQPSQHQHSLEVRETTPFPNMLTLAQGGQTCGCVNEGS